jgi:hypothetical protein
LSLKLCYALHASLERLTIPDLSLFPNRMHPPNGWWRIFHKSLATPRLWPDNRIMNASIRTFASRKEMKAEEYRSGKAAPPMSA